MVCWMELAFFDCWKNGIRPGTDTWCWYYRQVCVAFQQQKYVFTPLDYIYINNRNTEVVKHLVNHLFLLLNTLRTAYVLWFSKHSLERIFWLLFIIWHVAFLKIFIITCTGILVLLWVPHQSCTRKMSSLGRNPPGEGGPAPPPRKNWTCKTLF